MVGGWCETCSDETSSKSIWGTNRARKQLAKGGSSGAGLATSWAEWNSTCRELIGGCIWKMGVTVFLLSNGDEREGSHVTRLMSEFISGTMSLESPITQTMAWKLERRAVEMPVHKLANERSSTFESLSSHVRHGNGRLTFFFFIFLSV